MAAALLLVTTLASCPLSGQLPHDAPHAHLRAAHELYGGGAKADKNGDASNTKNKKLLNSAERRPLYQRDFTEGSVRITEPGRYYLAEDIVFQPNFDAGNCYDFGWPRAAQADKYALANEFGLGYFAAITIEATDVELDLNGKTIEQGRLHRLLQRFFAVIELASSPFLPGQGPHDFVGPSGYRAAERVEIHNGRIGRSSHHGIHGNMNRDVWIHDVEFDGFEVAGVALNGVAGLKLERCTMSNAKDVPVLGSWSSIRFMRAYLDFLQSAGSTTTLNVRGRALTITDVKGAIQQVMDNVFFDIDATGAIDCAAHPLECALFDNPTRVVDGNCYGLLLNRAGAAVNGFPLAPQAPYTLIPSSNVVMNDVDVRDLQCTIREVVGIRKGGSIVADSVGSVFQVLNRDATGNLVTIAQHGPSVVDSHYTGHAVADAQLFIAKAIAAAEFLGSDVDVMRNGITPDVVAWAEAGAAGSLATLTDDEGFQCNGDSMAHVQKGAIGFKIDGVVDARLTRVTVDTIVNWGAPGSHLCGDYEFSHPLATLPGYNGGHARGFSFAGSKRVKVRDGTVRGVRSVYGDACGFDVMTDSSYVELSNTRVEDLAADNADAIGYRMGPSASYSKVKKHCATGLTAGGTVYETLDLGGVRNQIASKESCKATGKGKQ